LIRRKDGPIAGAGARAGADILSLFFDGKVETPLGTLPFIRSWKVSEASPQGLYCNFMVKLSSPNFGEALNFRLYKAKDI